jgi:chromosome partitioning protein
MLVISFMTQKGGAGKSTIALSVAVAAQEAGDRVAILDLDPQASLVTWSQTRNRGDVVVEAANPENLSHWLTLLAESGVTLCIVDAAGTDVGAAAVAAMSACALFIVPARPNVFDLRAGEATRRMVQQLGGKAVFLLNQCPPSQQSARVQDGVRALEASGVLISPAISARVDFQDAARTGMGVTEINRHGHAAYEIRRLWTSIRTMTDHASAAENGSDTEMKLAMPEMKYEDPNFMAAA